MKRILVIEDDAGYRRMLKQTLEGRGYEVIEASNGQEGIQLYHQQRCALVITDIFMPEKEGLETIRDLKQEFPTVQIIALSGGGFEGHYAGNLGAETALEAARAFGADRILLKPVEIQRLLAIVDELIKSI